MSRVLICLLAGACIASCTKKEMPKPKQVEHIVEQAKGSQPKEGRMFANKPLVDVKVEVSGLPHLLFINGVRVSTDYMGVGADFLRPINELIRAGENELRFVAYPEREDDVPPEAWEFSAAAKAKLTLLVRQDGEPLGASKPFATIHYEGNSHRDAKAWKQSSQPGFFESAQGFKASKTGDVQIGPIKSSPHDDKVGLAIYRTFTIPYPHPQWKFFGSETLPKVVDFKPDEAMYQAVLKEYKHIRQLIIAKKLDELVALADERNRETDRAYYFEPGHIAGRLKKNLLSGLEASTGMPLHFTNSAPGNRWPTTVSLNGKLVWMDRNWTTTPLIVLQFKDNEGAGYNFPFLFRLDEKGKYIITR